MRTPCLLFLMSAAGLHAQKDSIDDRRVERAKGYHIISHPVRTGETPPDVKQEKASEDRRRRANTDIDNQTIPTREPELKPKTVQP